MKNKEVILCIIIIILIPIAIFSHMKWNDYKIEECKSKNGKMVIDNLGLIDKCIIGDDKE